MKNENTEKFIELISRYPVLYDLSHPYNRDQDMKNQIWAQLASTMNCEVKTVRNRWRGLKDTYSRHLKTVAGKHKYGKTPCKNWLWAKHMAFMQPFVGIRYQSGRSRRRKGGKARPKRDSTLKTADTTSVDTSQTVDNADSVDPKTTSASDPRNITDDIVEEPLPTASQYTNDPVTEASSLDKFVGFLENGKEMDAVDYLFLSWAKTVKQFSPRRLLNVKKKISDLIMEMEQDQLEEDDTLHYTSAIGESVVSNRECDSSCASSWSSRAASPVPDPLTPQSERAQNLSNPIIKSETNGYYQNGIR